MSPLTPVGSLDLSKLTIRYLIDPLECDGQIVLPVTFQVLPPLYKHYTDSLPDGYVRKIQRFNKHFIWCSVLGHGGARASPSYYRAEANKHILTYGQMRAAS